MANNYSAYTDVDQKWVAQIPSHWQAKRLKAVFSIRKEKNDPVVTDFILSLTAKQGVVPYAEKEGAGGNKPKDDLSKYNIAHENDLLVNCMNVVSGSAGVSKYYGAISPVYYALYPRGDENVWYYHYIFRLISFQRSLIGLGKGIMMHESDNGKLNTVRMRISMDNLGNVLLPVPPKSEQDQIVAYLNWKVSDINRLINTRRKQIELVKERELIIIDRLLTAGTNKNSNMQSIDSSWMPSIPAHWELSRIGNHFEIRKRIAGKEGFPVLSITQQGLKEKDISTNEGQMAANYSGYQFVYEGDFAMNHMDLITGYIDIASAFGVTSPDYRVFSLIDEEKCYAPYYLLLFQLCYRRRIFYAYGRGAATKGRWRMPAVNFKNFIIPLPPIDEQKNIVDAIKPLQKETNDVVDNITKQIELLQEMKASLISDVVTGRVDIRNAEIPDFEYVDEEADSEEEGESEDTEEQED